MEVLENGNCLKEPENQTSGNNYGCHLPRELTIGTNSVARSRVETDVGLLVACKAQLSSEVIRWKTESLRLQKERDSACQRAKELDELVVKISERAKELEFKLLQAQNENDLLRTMNSKKAKENVFLLQKLPKDIDKYHSFPWFEMPPKPVTFSLSRHEDYEFQRIQQSVHGDWKEVSQNLLEKMKLEMKELQELSSHFLSHDKDDQIQSATEEVDLQDCDEELERNISTLICETESLKHHLLQQRKKLKFLLNIFTEGEPYSAEEGIVSATSKNTEPISPDKKCNNFVNSKLSTNKFSRPSDESFRLYFTKQLGGLHDMDKMSKAMKLFLESGETKSILKDKAQQISAGLHSTKLHSSTSSEQPMRKEGMTEEKRVCPICQAPFGIIIPQKEFEEHVLDHLEAESASLLDQYVVL